MMVDSTSTPDFFSACPETIALHYQFKLAYHDHEGQRYYAILDWIRGIAKHEDSQAVSRFWYAFKARYRSLSERCFRFPYRATDGKVYLREYTDQQTLKYITGLMGAKTGISRQISTDGVIEVNTSSAGFIYIIGIKEHDSYYKIGKATKIERRLENIDGAMPFTAFLIHALPVENRHLTEKALHHFLKAYKIKKEWFRLSPSNIAEIVALSESQILALRNSEDVGEHAERTARRLGKDIATDRLLLPDETE